MNDFARGKLPELCAIRDREGWGVAIGGTGESRRYENLIDLRVLDPRDFGELTARGHGGGRPLHRRSCADVALGFREVLYGCGGECAGTPSHPVRR